MQTAPTSHVYVVLTPVWYGYAVWKLISPIVKQTQVANHEEDGGQQTENIESQWFL